MEMQLRTREYRFNVRGERFNRNPQGNFFTWRVMSIWKELPETGTIRTFLKDIGTWIGTTLRNMG